MVTATNILYSSSAVRRILGLDSSVSVRLKVFARSIWVWRQGKRPTFWSKQIFKQHFCEWRKQQAKSLGVCQVRPDEFVVSNYQKRTAYKVALEGGALCACDDFQNQMRFWGKGCCKHGYAVLSVLGYGSLEDYLNPSLGKQKALAA